MLSFKFILPCCSDAPFTHPFYLILHHVKFEEWLELKCEQENCTNAISLICILLCCLILYCNGLLRSRLASRLNQSFMKSNWKWHTFIEAKLKWISIPYKNEFPYLIKMNFHTLLIWEIRKQITNTDNLGFSLDGCSYHRDITTKHSQFYYWHSKEHILPGCLCFTMKWWQELFR